MKTRKHESEGNELLAGLSEAKFKFNDAHLCVFRGLMRLVPLENLLGTRRIDVFKAIYSLQLGTTFYTPSVPTTPNYSLVTLQTCQLTGLWAIHEKCTTKSFSN